MKPDYAQIMKLMGNTHCLAILLHLSRGGHSLDDLAGKTGYSSANISYHIKRLRDKGLVRGSRCGHRVCYRLVNDRQIREFVLDVVAVFARSTDAAA